MLLLIQSRINNTYLFGIEIKLVAHRRIVTREHVETFGVLTRWKYYKNSVINDQEFE
jgi:hypothetical protein